MAPQKFKKNPETLVLSTQSVVDAGLDLDRLGRDFVYFCNNCAYVIEPRPDVDDSDKDLDFEAYFAPYFNKIHSEKSLATDVPELLEAQALDLLLDEVAEVSGSEKRFNLYDYQVKSGIWLSWLLIKGESGAVEKCRDMGMTWLIVWWIVWNWRYKKRFSALLGSRKEKAVDNGKISSLFGKLDYAINKLVEQGLAPLGYDRSKHRTKLSIVNPENPANTLEGDSQTEDFGRSERHTFIFLDEYAFWDYDVSGSISQVARTVLYGSSVNGDNHFKKLVDRLKAISQSLAQRWEWWLNPEHTKNNNAWFKRMQALLEEADFAREVLIDYQASVKGKYYPICSIVKQLPHLDWTPGWPSDLAMDYGVGDNMAMIWWQRNHEATLHRMMYAYTNSGKPIEFYIPFMRALHPDQAVYLADGYGKPVLDQDGRQIYKELTKVYEYCEDDLAFIAKLQAAGVSGNLEYRGDPAGRQRSQDTAISIEQKLAGVGIYVFSNTKLNDYLSRRSALTEVLMKTEVNMDGAYAAFNAISQSKYPERRENSQSTSTPNAPVHDWTSHYRSAAEYHAVGEENRGTVAVLNSFQMGTAAPAPTGINAILARARKGE